MKRLFAAAVFAASLFAIPAMADAPNEQAMVRFMRDVVEEGDWTYLTASMVSAHYIRDPNPARPTLIEARVEYYDAQETAGFAYRSETNTMEVRCQSTEYRTVARKAYARNNLQGGSQNLPLFSDGRWIPAREGTLAEDLVTRVCRNNR